MYSKERLDVLNMFMILFFSYPSISDYIMKDAMYVDKQVHRNTDNLLLQKSKWILKTNTIKKNDVIVGL